MQTEGRRSNYLSIGLMTSVITAQMWDYRVGLWDQPEANIGVDMTEVIDVLYVINIRNMQVHSPFPPVRAMWPFVDLLNGARVNVGDVIENECEDIRVVFEDSPRYITNAASSVGIVAYNIFFEGEGPIQILPDGSYIIEARGMEFRVTVEVIAEVMID